MSKRTFQILAIIVVVLAAIGIFGVWTVSAQGPWDDDHPMFGRGMMGGRHHGGMWGYGQHGMWGQGGMMFGGQSLLDAAATALNLEPEALIEALQSGKTLSEIAAEQGIEPQELTNALLAERQEYLNSLVEQGYLTQEQADQMLAHMNEELAEHLDFMFTGNGRGWGVNCPFFE